MQKMKKKKKKTFYTKMKLKFFDVLAFFQLKTKVLLVKYGCVLVFGKL
jgi:hypothetical protein